MPNCDYLWKRSGGVLEDCLYILLNSRKMQVLSKKRGRMLEDSLKKNKNKKISQPINSAKKSNHAPVQPAVSVNITITHKLLI